MITERELREELTKLFLLVQQRPLYEAISEKIQVIISCLEKDN